MFAHHQGTETRPVATVGRSFNPLWWVATIDDTKNEMYLKVVNSGDSSIPLTINLNIVQRYQWCYLGTFTTSEMPSTYMLTLFCPDVGTFDRLQLPRQSDCGGCCYDWSLAQYLWKRFRFCVGVPAYSINVIQFDLSQAVSAGTNPSPVARPSGSGPPVSYTSDGQPQNPTTMPWA
jgi:hypothetical protein